MLQNTQPLTDITTMDLNLCQSLIRKCLLTSLYVLKMPSYSFILIISYKNRPILTDQTVHIMKKKLIVVDGLIFFHVITDMVIQKHPPPAY